MNTQISNSPSGVNVLLSQTRLRTASRRIDQLCGKLLTCLALGLLSLLGGCGGSSQTGSQPTQGLATPPPASQINSYFGTDANIWSINIDHSNNQITGKDVTNGVSLAGSAAGNFAQAGGFLNITLSPNGTPPNLVGQIGGFALDITGRAALLRLGDQSNPLIPLVSTVSCIAIGGTVTYQYVTIPGAAWNQQTDTAYGIFQASTVGPNWTLANIKQFTLAGAAPANPGAGVPAGYCAQSTLGFAVTAASNSTNPPIATITMGFSSSGFFVEDNGSQQALPQGVLPSNAIGAGVGAIGMLQPSTALSTANVVGAKYLGFFYEPIPVSSPNSQVTQLVSFGCSGSFCPTPPTPTSIVGGVFPNDDPTQQPGQNMSIDLGQQDPQNNGLYPSAKVTVSGVSFPAVAIVSNPENKFAVYLIAQDTLNVTPLAIYLLQQ